jgi:membrane-associated phospholipid phosphatase
MNPPPDSSPGRKLIVALLSCVVLTTLAILFVDRAASTWSYTELHRPVLCVWLTHIVDPLPWVAAGGLLCGGAAVALGWRPGECGKTGLACCASVALAIMIKEQLKYAFGRTWPETWTNHNPSWISNAAYGFHPFHGGEGWSSFPSGHTTVITAFAAVLWLRVPSLRWLAVTLVVLVVGGLLGSDFHWVGDMVAGAFLGTASAVSVVTVVRQLRP